VTRITVTLHEDHYTVTLHEDHYTVTLHEDHYTVTLHEDHYTVTLHEDHYTVLIASPSFLLRMRNISDKSFRETTHILHSITLFSKIVPFMR